MRRGPTLSLAGVQFTFLIGGTVIVERIFAYPGIGSMAIDAVTNRDLPLIQGLVMVFGALFILINLTVDFAVATFKPAAAPWLISRPPCLPRRRTIWPGRCALCSRSRRSPGPGALSFSHCIGLPCAVDRAARSVGARSDVRHFAADRLCRA